MMGLILGLKGRLFAIGGIIIAVLASVAAIYAKGRKDQINRQRVVAVKEYHKTKEKLQAVKKKVKDQSAQKDREDIQKRLAKLKEYKS